MVGAGDFIPYLKLLHGSYNLTVLCFFLYQGLLGLRIRKRRKAGLPPDVKTVKRHRKQGPVLALIGVGGYLLGLTVIYLDVGHVFEYPPHFLGGSLIASMLITTYLVSKRIRGERFRTPHFALGLAVLTVYPLQALLGIGALL